MIRVKINKAKNIDLIEKVQYSTKRFPIATAENKIKIDFNAVLIVFKYETPLPMLYDFV